MSGRVALGKPTACRGREEKGPSPGKSCTHTTCSSRRRLLHGAVTDGSQSLSREPSAVFMAANSSCPTPPEKPIKRAEQSRRHFPILGSTWKVLPHPAQELGSGPAGGRRKALPCTWDVHTRPGTHTRGSRSALQATSSQTEELRRKKALMANCLRQFLYVNIKFSK